MGPGSRPTTHHAPRITHHAPRTTHHAPRLPFFVPQAFPLSYDAELHRAISVAFFIIAAARAVTEGFAAPKVVAILCVLKFFAAIGAILVNLPLTAKYIPAFHLGGYVPCLDATPWVAESAALGLVLLTTTVNIFMSRHENNDRYKHLAGSTLY